MTCTRCQKAPGQPRRNHAERVFCDACAALPPIVEYENPPIPRLVEAVEPTERHLTFTAMSSIQAKHVRWLQRDFVPLGKLTVLAGPPGLGKSMLTVKLAGQVSNGTTDGDLFRTPADVLMVSAEDDPQDTTKPRLLAIGADCDRVHLVDVRENHAPGFVELPGDIERIERGVERFGAKLVVLDPIVALLDATKNSYREQDVRQVLGPLAALAQRHTIAVLAIMHLNKSDTKNTLDKIGHSGGFTQAARSVLIFGRDPEADGGQADEFSDAPQLRILANEKANSGPDGAAMRLRLEPTLVEERGERFKTARLEEVGRVNMSAADLLGDPEDRSELAEAAEFLRDLLADGPVWSGDVKRAAAEAGFSWRTVERARKPAGCAKPYKQDGPSGRWMWALKIDREKLARDEPSPPPDDTLADGGVGGVGEVDPGKSAKSAKSAKNPDGEDGGLPDSGNVGGVGGVGGVDGVGGVGEADCSKKDEHRDRWVKHPETGRLICPICHGTPS